MHRALSCYELGSTEGDKHFQERLFDYILLVQEQVLS
jgi:hypothetical protein